MFFKMKSNILFRNFGSFGFVTDNDNYRYKLTDETAITVGEKVLSESGALFFSALTHVPQHLNTIVHKVVNCFEGADFGTIYADASDFFSSLAEDGFVAIGKTYAECEENDYRFTYEYTNSQITSSKPTIENQPWRSTQEHFDSFFEGKSQLRDLHIEVTSRCNERCVHCFIPHEKKLNDIDPILFSNIVQQCKSMNVLHLTLSGGEPMLHNDFCDFLKICRDCDFSVSILSNLTLLDNIIINEMKANPLLGVQVSLYSMIPDIHDSITTIKGSFEKTKAGILRLVAENIPVQISCPIMKQNRDSYNLVKQWAKGYRINVVDDYVIIAKYNHSTQNLANRLQFSDVQELLTERIHSDPNFRMQLKEEAQVKSLRAPEDYICSVCSSSICISEVGQVYPCAGWQDYALGDLNNSLLKDIWDNSEKVNYLRNLRRRDFPKCNNCPDKDFCTMCMVRNANEAQDGSPLVVNEYFCNIAKLNKYLSNQVDEI